VVGGGAGVGGGSISLLEGGVGGGHAEATEESSVMREHLEDGGFSAGRRCLEGSAFFNSVNTERALHTGSTLNTVHTERAVHTERSAGMSSSSISRRPDENTDAAAAGPQFICFTGTKVQILTQLQQLQYMSYIRKTRPGQAILRGRMG
jgi:hypothetical protein